MGSLRTITIPGSYFEEKHDTPMKLEPGENEGTSASHVVEQRNVLDDIKYLLKKEREWHRRQNHRYYHVVDLLTEIHHHLESLRRVSVNDLETMEHLGSKITPSSLLDHVRAHIPERSEPYRPKVALLSSSQAVSDTLIESKWGNLDYSITNLAMELAKLTFKSRKEAGYELHHWAPELTTATDILYFGENTKDAGICGYIWRRLTSLIFCDEADIWESDVTRAWKDYRRTLIRSCFEKNDMQKLTTGMAQVQAEGFFEASPQKITQIARTESEVFHALAQDASGFNIDDLSKRLDEIIEMAANIEGVFLASRAVFEVDWLHGRQTRLFNEDEMTAVPYPRKDAASKRVYFICRPLLRKTGNMEGQHYDVSHVLVKAGAVFKEPASCDKDSNTYTKTVFAI